jgi:hypothetical protein
MEEDRLFLVTIPEFSDRVIMPCTHGKTRTEAIFLLPIIPSFIKNRRIRKRRRIIIII